MRYEDLSMFGGVERSNSSGSPSSRAAGLFKDLKPP